MSLTPNRTGRPEIPVNIQDDPDNKMPAMKAGILLFFGRTFRA